MMEDKNHLNKELRKLVKDTPNDRVGKIFFQKGVKAVLEHKHTMAWEYFKLGIDTVTCDCDDGWLPPSKDLKGLFRRFEDFSEENRKHILGNQIKWNPYFYNMVFLLSYFKDDESIESVDDGLRFLDITGGGDDDWYYQYLYNKDLVNCEYFNYESIEREIEVINYEVIIRSGVLYRIGKAKREANNCDESGLSEIFLAFELNPKSYCCAS
jgi:hypothetical protein